MDLSHKQNKLKDFGYQHKTILVEADQYVKVLEHSKEKEVTEEIIVLGNSIHRRLRIIEWDTSGSAKKSKKIRYQQLPVPEDIEVIVKTG